MQGILGRPRSANDRVRETGQSTIRSLADGVIPEMTLAGKTAIVTGGATGIGRAIAMKLAGNGANVVVADLQIDAGRETAENLEQFGVGSLACVADVADENSVRSVTDMTLERFGSVEILINNAGVSGARNWYQHIPAWDEDWAACYEVNLRGMVNMTEAVERHMQDARLGKIVNIASIAGREGRPAIAHYSASKAAVISYTQSLATRLAPDNINVNAICPGLLWSPMWEQVGLRYGRMTPGWENLSAREVFEKSIELRVPLRREQMPDDVGELAAFLSSEDARNITAQAIHVDGGAVMR